MIKTIYPLKGKRTLCYIIRGKPIKRSVALWHFCFQESKFPSVPLHPWVLFSFSLKTIDSAQWHVAVSVSLCQCVVDSRRSVRVQLVWFWAPSRTHCHDVCVLLVWHIDWARGFNIKAMPEPPAFLTTRTELGVGVWLRGWWWWWWWSSTFLAHVLGKY